MAVAVTVLLAACVTALDQGENVAIQRFADGRPDLNGIWQTLSTANWDLELHGAEPAPVSSLAVVAAVPPGLSVVDGGSIPYLPFALTRRHENRANRWVDDPELKCYLPGVPRATYMPYPFQIVQSTQYLTFAYEYAGAFRNVNMGEGSPSPVDSWMGWSNGSWDDDTLVVDVTGFNGLTWLDRSGNYHSSQLHVVERYTPLSANVLAYEATIEDPEVFTEPWTIRMPLYRNLDNNAAIMEFKCVEFAEELIYGHLRANP
jgi:hypothetical protein